VHVMNLMVVILEWLHKKE